MGSIINYIAKETSGNSFTSFKYCFDGQPIPHVEYESAEDSYVNLTLIPQHYSLTLFISA